MLSVRPFHPYLRTYFMGAPMGVTNKMNQSVVKYRYPKEKMVVFPVSLNGRCYSSRCVGIVTY